MLKKLHFLSGFWNLGFCFLGAALWCGSFCPAYSDLSLWKLLRGNNYFSCHYCQTLSVLLASLLITEISKSLLCHLLAAKYHSQAIYFFSLLQDGHETPANFRLVGKSLWSLYRRQHTGCSFGHHSKCVRVFRS